MTAWLDVLRLMHTVAGLLALRAAAMYAIYVFAAGRRSDLDGAVWPLLRVRHDFPQALATFSALALVIGFVVDSATPDVAGPMTLSFVAGLGFAVGGLATLGALALGEAVLGPTAAQLSAIGTRLDDEAPTPRQVDQLKALSTRLDRAERVDLALLTVAVLSVAALQLATWA